MNIEIKLEVEEVKKAITRYVTKVLRLNCKEDNVQIEVYSWDTPKIIIDVQEPATQENADTKTSTDSYF